MQNLIVLTGQTASGKSELAVELATFLEKSGQKTVIFSLDSRQVYKQLNLGSGKVLGQWKMKNDFNNQENLLLFKNFKEIFFYKNIPHFLIDFIDPSIRFSLFDFAKEFICTQKKLPKNVKNIILVGGTGLFGTAILQKYPFENMVLKNEKYFEMEKRLGKNSLENVRKIGKKIGINLAKNESENGNKTRIINKILTKTFSVENEKLVYPEFKKIVVLEKVVEQKNLEEKILKRLEMRVFDGMVEEVLDLKIGLKRLVELGLEYRIIGLFLHGFLDEAEWKNLLFKEIKNYAKRQKTWNKKYLNGEKVTDLNSVLTILKENQIL